MKQAQPGDYNIFLVSGGLCDYYRFCKAGFGDVINEANIPNLANVLEPTLAAFLPQRSEVSSPSRAVRLRR